MSIKCFEPPVQRLIPVSALLIILILNCVYTCHKAFCSSTTSDKAMARQLFSRGALALKRDRNEEAVKLFEQGLKLDNTNPDAYSDIANAYIGLNKPKIAERFARKAIALAPTEFSPRYILALALIDQNRYREARDVLLRASRLKKSLPQQKWFDRRLAELNEYLEHSRH